MCVDVGVVMLLTMGCCRCCCSGVDVAVAAVVAGVVVGVAGVVIRGIVGDGVVWCCCCVDC